MAARLDFGWRRCVAAPFVALAALCLTAAPAAAQTDYWWNAPTGGVGNWDTTAIKWSTTNAAAPTYVWSNSGTERANIGGTRPPSSRHPSFEGHEPPPTVSDTVWCQGDLARHQPSTRPFGNRPRR